MEHITWDGKVGLYKSLTEPTDTKDHLHTLP
jgi:hypothetical protein